MKTTVKTSQLPELFVTCTFDLCSIHAIDYVTAKGASRSLDIEDELDEDVHHVVTKRLQDIATHVSIELIGSYAQEEQVLKLALPSVAVGADDLVGIHEAVCAVPVIAKLRKSMKAPWTKSNLRPALATANKECAVLCVYEHSQNYWNLELCHESMDVLKEWFYENWIELYEHVFTEIGRLYRASKDCETRFQDNNAKRRMDDSCIGLAYLTSQEAEQKLKAMTANEYFPQFMEIKGAHVESLDFGGTQDFLKSVQDQ